MEKQQQLNKRRKSGARKRLDRRKTHAPKTTSHAPTPPTALPTNWQALNTNEYAKIENKGENEMSHIASTINIAENGSFTVFFNGQMISATNSILSALPKHICSTATLQEIISAIDKAVLCPGNPEENFVDVCKRRPNAQICGERGIGDIVGYLDKRNAQGIIITVVYFYELLTLRV